MVFHLVDVFFLTEKCIFSPVDISKNKKKELEQMTKLYVHKFDKIIQSETAQGFNSKCVVYFAKRDIPTTITGAKRKENTVVLCFPGANTAEIKKTFTKLFKKKFLGAVNKEEDYYKIQELGKLNNLPVKYFTPYVLYKFPNLSKLPITFVNLNNNGISYSLKDVSFGS